MWEREFAAPRLLIRLSMGDRSLRSVVSGEAKRLEDRSEKEVGCGVL